MQKKDQKKQEHEPVKKTSPQKRDSVSSGYGSDEPDNKKRKVTRDPITAVTIIEDYHISTSVG